MSEQKLQQHPLSQAFPAMGLDDFQALKDSIETIGVQNPVTLFEGMVIDGWHRYSAASELGIECPTVELSDVDPRDFVLAQNKARRHITVAQIALATAAVYAWHPQGGDRRSVSKDTECPLKTTAEIADAAGVHINTIKQAKAVRTNAVPEVIEAIKNGEIGLPKAAAISKLPKDEQAAAIAKPLPKQKPEQHEDDGPSPEEVAEAIRAQQDDADAVRLILEADDALAAMTAKCKQQAAQIRILEERVRGLTNEAAQAVRLAKSWRAKCEKLEKVAA